MLTLIQKISLLVTPTKEEPSVGTKRLLISLTQRYLGISNCHFIDSLIKLFAYKNFRIQHKFSEALKIIRPTDNIIIIGDKIEILASLISRKVFHGGVIAFENRRENLKLLYRIFSFLELKNANAFPLKKYNASNENSVVYHDNYELACKLTDKKLALKNISYNYLDQLDRFHCFPNTNVDVIFFQDLNHSLHTLEISQKVITHHLPLIMCRRNKDENLIPVMNILGEIGYECHFIEKGKIVPSTVFSNDVGTFVFMHNSKSADCLI